MNFGEEVARRPIFGLDAATLDAKLGAAGSGGRNGERDRSLRRWHVDLRSRRGLGEGDRDAHVEPGARATEERMGAGANGDENVAGGRAFFAGLALAAEADFFAVIDAGRDFELDRFDIAVGPSYGNCRFAAEHRRGKRNRELVFEVGASRWRRWAAFAAGPAAELLEEVGKTAGGFRVAVAAAVAEDVVQIEWISLWARGVSPFRLSGRPLGPWRRRPIRTGRIAGVFRRR